MKRLPRTHEQLAKMLSDAAVAGYLAGMRDKANGNAPPRIVAANRRRQIRAELQRWMR